MQDVRVSHHPWRKTVSMASGRSRRKCARYTRRRAVAISTPPNDSSANCGSGLQYVPRVIITDKLKSYAAAKREILPGVEHRQHARVEQSGRELAPTHTTPREEDETFQISPHRPNVFSLLIASHFRAFPTSSSPFERRRISCHFTGSLSGVERGNQGKASGIITIRPQSHFALQLFSSF